MKNETKQTAVDELIAEVKRRVSIIQSEPQTMARELMIENLAIDLDSFKELHKEQISNAFLKGYDYCNSRDLEEQDDDFEFDFYEQTYGDNK